MTTRVVASTLLDLGEVRHASDRHPDDLHHVGEIHLGHAIIARVVVHVEAIVRELDGDQHRLPAVVDEPGVVRTVVDRVVVRVDDVQVQVVLSRRTRESHDQLVRAVRVFAVVDVDPVTRLAAVADHVHLEDTDDVFLGSGALVAVLVAAPEALLLAREMDEAHGVVQLVVLQRASHFQNADGAGGIVIRAGSDILVGPRAADSRVQVPGHDDDLAGVLRAGNFGNDIFQLLAAHRVGSALDRDAERLVPGFHPVERVVQLLVVGIARRDLDGLTVDHSRDFTRQLIQHVGDAGDGHCPMSRNDASILGGQVGDVDGRGGTKMRATHFVGIELAAAGGVLAAVNSVELTIVRLALIAMSAAIVAVVMIVTMVRSGGRLAKSRSDEENSSYNQRGDNRKSDDCIHVRSPWLSLRQPLPTVAGGTA